MVTTHWGPGVPQGIPISPKTTRERGRACQQHRAEQFMLLADLHSVPTGNATERHKTVRYVACGDARRTVSSLDSNTVADLRASAAATSTSIPLSNGV